MNEPYILDVRGLNTYFRGTDRKTVHIVKNVSLQMRRGTTLAIVGESGCGKSVTVHSITRLVPRNAEVEAEQILFQPDPDGLRPSYRMEKMKPYGREVRALRGMKIGMIFQEPMSSLNPVQRVGVQIAEGLREHTGIGRKEAREKALEMIKLLGVPDAQARIDCYPHELSGGMKQRIGIAIAMICNPELLIADEPTTALDVTIQAQIMELMKKLQVELGKSIILITHNMGLVAEMADDVCVMYMGRVVEFGSLQDIFKHPSHPYTRALLDSVPKLGHSRDQLLVTIPGSTPNPANLKDGCDFANRCAHCRDACRTGAIGNYEISPRHNVRCLEYAQYPEVKP